MFLSDLQITQELPPRRGAFFFLTGGIRGLGHGNDSDAGVGAHLHEPQLCRGAPDNVELWSPDNPIFPTPEITAEPMELPEGAGMKAFIGIHEPLEDTLA